jgi:hypothetical protein
LASFFADHNPPDGCGHKAEALRNRRLPGREIREQRVQEEKERLLNRLQPSAAMTAREKLYHQGIDWLQYNEVLWCEYLRLAVICSC